MLHVVGKLEVAGIVEPLEFAATLQPAGDRLAVEATTTVDPRRFGMSTGVLDDPPTRDAARQGAAEGRRRWAAFLMAETSTHQRRCGRKQRTTPHARADLCGCRTNERSSP